MSRQLLSVRGIAREALGLLEEYLWRGNVRELEAIVEQAMIFGDGDWINPQDVGSADSAGG